MNVRTGIASAALAVGVVASCQGLPAMADTAAQLPPRAHWMATPCPEEDSVDCTWNAGASGNGSGHSFYVVRRHLENAHGGTVGRVVCVYYVARADARRWDACHLLPAGQDGTFGR